MVPELERIAVSFRPSVVATASRAFGNQACADVVAEAEPPAEAQNISAPEQDGFPAAGMVGIGSYSVLVLSRDNSGK